MVPQSLTRSIIALGVPLIVGQLGVVLQTFADTMMVGQYGTMELSAAGFVNNMFNMVIFFMLGISYSTVPYSDFATMQEQHAHCKRVC